MCWLIVVNSVKYCHVRHPKSFGFEFLRMICNFIILGMTFSLSGVHLGSTEKYHCPANSYMVFQVRIRVHLYWSERKSNITLILLVDGDRHGDGYVTIIVVNVNKILVLPIRRFFCQSQHPFT